MFTTKKKSFHERKDMCAPKKCKGQTQTIGESFILDHLAL